MVSGLGDGEWSPLSSVSQQVASNTSRFFLASSNFCFFTILSKCNLTFLHLNFLSAFFKEYFRKSSNCTNSFLFCSVKEGQISGSKTFWTSASAYDLASVCTADSRCCCWPASRFFSWVSQCSSSKWNRNGSFVHLMFVSNSLTLWRIYLRGIISCIQCLQ